MNQPVKHGVDKVRDSIQQRLTSYACDLSYANLTPEAIHASKGRVIDTLGALIGGYFGESCRIARSLAAEMPDADGATVIGTRLKTTPDMAAFVNAIAACHADMADSYHNPGSFHGHPSNVLMPVLAVAEHARRSGREFITGLVLAYEVYARFSDVFHNKGFDCANFACLGTAVAAGKLLRLSPDQLAHCISMAVVPNNMLQTRMGELTMFYTVAPGQAGRAGVFAALLARAGMEGPHLPFEGKAGWCEHVARERFSLNALGGNGTRFKILDSQIKNRPATGNMIPSILAAEKVARCGNLGEVERITVEVYKYAKEHGGSEEQNPDTREAAYHSIPYLVAATLIDGTVTLRSFNSAHLGHPGLRKLMQKVEVIENAEFTKAYEREPQEHRTRVTVVTASGERLVGETGGDQEDMSAPKSDAQLVEKFRGLTEDVLSSKQTNFILDRLWRLEEVPDMGAIPADLVFV